MSTTAACRCAVDTRSEAVSTTADSPVAAVLFLVRPLTGPAGAEAPGVELFLMCDELTAEVEALAARAVTCSPVEQARWGSITKITLPGGGAVGSYQPKHPLALDRDG
jgi:hypothetical protein